MAQQDGYRRQPDRDLQAQVASIHLANPLPQVYTSFILDTTLTYSDTHQRRASSYQAPLVCNTSPARPLLLAYLPQLLLESIPRNVEALHASLWPNRIDSLQGLPRIPTKKRQFTSSEDPPNQLLPHLSNRDNVELVLPLPTSVFPKIHAYKPLVPGWLPGRSLGIR